MSKVLNRVGEVSYTKYGTKAIIIKYEGKNDVYIQFDDEYKYVYKTTYSDFLHREIRNPYDKSVCNMGYIGVGIYKSRIKGQKTKVYNIWEDMIRRCYSYNKYQTYKDCIVSDIWLNFQNFAQWYEQNYYEVNNRKMCLDKDILVKGNKIYSPNKCVFVPDYINSLFIKCNANRGEYPIGVIFDKERNKFIASCSIIENNKIKNKFLGRYKVAEEAFYAYKTFKENYIQKVAEFYKQDIPDELYTAMINYKVEITD
jgi:hypothetical protein